MIFSVALYELLWCIVYFLFLHIWSTISWITFSLASFAWSTPFYHWLLLQFILCSKHVICDVMYFNVICVSSNAIIWCKFIVFNRMPYVTYPIWKWMQSSCPHYLSFTLQLHFQSQFCPSWLISRLCLLSNLDDSETVFCQSLVDKTFSPCFCSSIVDYTCHYIFVQAQFIGHSICVCVCEHSSLVTNHCLSSMSHWSSKSLH